MTCLLEAKNLHVEAGGRPILNGIDFKIKNGELHVITGANGSGKSSFAFSILGHPDYKITKGDIIFGGKKINGLKTHERSRLGIFLGFQSPVSFDGVSLFHVVKAVREAKKQKDEVFALKNFLNKRLASLGLGEDFASRSLNHNFSGGEKKKMEFLQAMFFQPRLAIFDEIEAGLDAESLKIIISGAALFKKRAAVIFITHDQRVIDAVSPDKIHVMSGGSFRPRPAANFYQTAAGRAKAESKI